MGRAWPAIERSFRELKIPFTLRFTEYRGHAMRLAEEAVLAGAQRIMAIGGDGTNHETVHGLFSQQHRPPEEITYALLPFGTGNDWADSISCPSNHARACSDSFSPVRLCRILASWNITAMEPLKNDTS